MTCALANDTTRPSHDSRELSCAGAQSVCIDRQVALLLQCLCKNMASIWFRKVCTVVQVDVWALGISAIEMAETVPPRWSVHPMRVIFQISREDPPRLAEWERWSLTFHDFVRLCLVKDARVRPTAAQLEQHRFAVAARQAGPPDLSPLVAKARQLIAAKAAAAASTLGSTVRHSLANSTIECASALGI